MWGDFCFLPTPSVFFSFLTHVSAHTCIQVRLSWGKGKEKKVECLSWLTCIPCEQKVVLRPYCPVGIFSKLKGLLMLFCSVYHLFNAPRHRHTASGNAHWRSAVNRHTVIYMHKNTEEDSSFFYVLLCAFFPPMHRIEHCICVHAKTVMTLKENKSTPIFDCPFFKYQHFDLLACIYHLLDYLEW